MENGKKSNKSESNGKAYGVWEGANIEVIHDSRIESTDGQFLSVREILEVLLRGWIRAGHVVCESDAVTMARVRVHCRYPVDENAYSVIVQLDLREDESLELRVQEFSPITPSEGTVEIAGMPFDLL